MLRTKLSKKELRKRADRTKILSARFLFFVCFVGGHLALFCEAREILWQYEMLSKIIVVKINS